jgi:cytochrome c oxidase cbb3-type subunit III
MSAAPFRIGSVRKAWAHTVGALALCVAAVSAVQNPPPSETGLPPANIDAGMRLFRERCAECHGADGRGVARHDLTRLWAAGATDAQVSGVIRSGVPNTIMPSSSAPDDEIRAIVSYLRSLNTVTGEEPSTGSLAAGEKTFQAMCATCHAIDGRGGRLGPDLSRAGQTQSRQQLTTSIRTPNMAVANGYRAVTLVTRDGRRIRGAEKSEDAFSIQIMDTQERLQGYLKADLREIIVEPASLMPAFPAERLSNRDLDDLLTFLSRGAAPAASRR